MWVNNKVNAQQRGGIQFSAPAQYVDVSRWRNECGAAVCEAAAIECGANWQNRYLVPAKNYNKFLATLRVFCEQNNSPKNINSSQSGRPISASTSNTISRSTTTNNTNSRSSFGAELGSTIAHALGDAVVDIFLSWLFTPKNNSQAPEYYFNGIYYSSEYERDEAVFLYNEELKRQFEEGKLELLRQLLGMQQTNIPSSEFIGLTQRSTNSLEFIGLQTNANSLEFINFPSMGGLEAFEDDFNITSELGFEYARALDGSIVKLTPSDNSFGINTDTGEQVRDFIDDFFDAYNLTMSAAIEQLPINSVYSIVLSNIVKTTIEIGKAANRGKPLNDETFLKDFIINVGKDSFTSFLVEKTGTIGEGIVYVGDKTETIHNMMSKKAFLKNTDK